MKDVRLPQDLQRAMAAEAEASREARAKVRWKNNPRPMPRNGGNKRYSTTTKVLIRVEVKTLQVIAAEGEQKASKALKEASDIITESAAALQLR